MSVVLYVLFFLSGAAALIYQVAWVRSLSLLFGGSHLAVTTVLSVFMGGLALGGAWIGRRVEGRRDLLRIYGWLEIGIAVGAVAFEGLVKGYPFVYVSLAGILGDAPMVLTAVRVLLAGAVLLGPTTLMGGTLPVLTRFAETGGAAPGTKLPLLYGWNTLGAVAGTLAAGFWFLPRLGLSATVATAVATNLLVGAAALALAPTRRSRTDPSAPRSSGPVSDPDRDRPLSRAAGRAVLVGIGVSGFCALGYEVLWTRVLGMVIGTSVYGFTLMLVAFLAGIALGSTAFAAVRRRRTASLVSRSWVVAFGLVEIGIGASALAVTYALRNLPQHALAVQSAIVSAGGSEFAVRQLAGFAVALAYMFVPAFLMGVAFPLAGTVHSASIRSVARGVGDTLAWNTLGAILGAATSGFLLIFLVGLERSLQVLAVLNLGVGLWAAATVVPRAAPRVAAATLTVLSIGFLAWNSTWAKFWNAELMAIYRNNQREAFDTKEEVQDALRTTEVLFFREGINETISVIRHKGEHQAVIVNGKAVSTTMLQDLQCVRALGHVPMLLHPDPKKVFVLGLGTGITLGSVSVHPELEEMVLAEIEPNVLGAARTFSEFNHSVADDPRLRIAWNDGRNFLLTTRDRFDVITADPIHPWSRGSAYLYTDEYFRLAAARLRPGGLMCQWLPIYELTPDDLAVVVRTFSENFRHVLLWLTFWDAELIGSNEPIVLDPENLRKRISHPRVSADLAEVEMGSVDDFLSYFVAGTRGLAAFAARGALNTDDNLRLEFSAPRSVGLPGLIATNAEALSRIRESLTSYARRLPDSRAEEEWSRRLGRLDEAGPLFSRAHVAWLRGGSLTPEFQEAFRPLREGFPDYAPTRFLSRQQRMDELQEPKLVRQIPFEVMLANGRRGRLVLSAVKMHAGERRGSVILVDNDERKIYGRLYLDGSDADEVDRRMDALASEVLHEAETAYASDLAKSRGLPPSRSRLSARIESLVRDRVR